jgi:hypothetical protein
MHQAVAASQSDEPVGNGKSGDYLEGVTIIPATTSPGAVSINDGVDEIEIFAGGADSVANLVPFFVAVDGIAKGAGWTITTGANVSVLAVGKF